MGLEMGRRPVGDLLAYFAPDVEKGRCRVELWKAEEGSHEQT